MRSWCWRTRVATSRPACRDSERPWRARARWASPCCRSASRWWPCSSRCCSWAGRWAAQSISFQAMQDKLRAIVNIIRSDPAVDTVVGFTGGSRAGGGFMFINLKDPSERKGVAGQAVIARLRPQLAQVTGISLFLNPVQDVRMGGRQTNSTYQYTLKSDNVNDL